MIDDGRRGPLAARARMVMVGCALTLMVACEAKSDVSSEFACTSYCEKLYDCDDIEPTNGEIDACAGTCRNSIEDNCGNDLQDDANVLIQECVDLACDDFLPCLVFDQAPECFDFVR